MLLACRNASALERAVGDTQMIVGYLQCLASMDEDSGLGCLATFIDNQFGTAFGALLEHFPGIHIKPIAELRLQVDSVYVNGRHEFQYYHDQIQLEAGVEICFGFGFETCNSTWIPVKTIIDVRCYAEGSQVGHIRGVSGC